MNLSPGTSRCRRLTVNPDLSTIEVRLADALLRHHREAVRWTVEEATAELGCDASTISRIETGHRRLVPGDMIKLLTAYGVSHRKRQDIAALTQGARADWWGEYRGLIPDGMVDHDCWNRSPTT